MCLKEIKKANVAVLWQIWTVIGAINDSVFSNR